MGDTYAQGQLQPMTADMVKAQRDIAEQARSHGLVMYYPAVSLGDGVYHEGERMDDDGAVPIHDESVSVTAAVSVREMDLRNMRALLDQRDREIEALMSKRENLALLVSSMADRNADLAKQIEDLTRQIQGNAPAPKPEPVPHNPWGKRHDGRAPDVGEPR